MEDGIPPNSFYEASNNLDSQNEYKQQIRNIIQVPRLNLIYNHK